MATARIDAEPLKRLLRQAFDETMPELNSAFRDTIASPVFDWVRQTKRRNGETVGSPRNIVDLGVFLNSQSYQIIAPGNAEFTWTAPYAVHIYYGWTSRGGTEVKGRDWVKATFERFNLAEKYAEKVKAKL